MEIFKEIHNKCLEVKYNGYWLMVASFVGSVMANILR